MRVIDMIGCDVYTLCVRLDTHLYRQKMKGSVPDKPANLLITTGVSPNPTCVASTEIQMK